MGKPYPVELRQRVVDHVAEGNTHRATAARFARLATFEVEEIGQGQDGQKQDSQKQDSQEIRVRITGVPAALMARMEDEFCNHALFQTIQMGRA